MKPLVLALKQEPDQRLDLAPLALHLLEGKSVKDIAAIELQSTRETITVGDIFKIRSGGTESIRFEGGSARLDNIGMDMKAGEIVVEGDCGKSFGRSLSGGNLVLTGECGPFAGSAISTTPEFIKSNPKTVQAFVNGMIKALHWLQKASVDEIADALPPEFYAGDKEFYKKAVQANREMLSKDGIVTPALSGNTFRIISSFNESVKNAKIDMTKTYDASFAENANKAMH